MEVNGQPMEIVEELTTVEPYKTFGMRFDTEQMINDLSVHFEEIDANTTKITTDNTFEGKGLIMRSIMACMQSMFKKQTEKNYDTFKAMVEGTPILVVDPAPLTEQDSILVGE
jgi:hypothetical protein